MKRTAVQMDPESLSGMMEEKIELSDDVESFGDDDGSGDGASGWKIEKNMLQKLSQENGIM